jgi:hypothetical protein
MVQLQFRIAIENGKLIILSETLVDHLVDEKELKVSHGLEKVFQQASKKAAELSGMDLTIIQLDQTGTEPGPKPEQGELL